MYGIYNCCFGDLDRRTSSKLFKRDLLDVYCTQELFKLTSYSKANTLELRNIWNLSWGIVVCGICYFSLHLKIKLFGLSLKTPL